jgi:plastocyanin
MRKMVVLAVLLVALGACANDESPTLETTAPLATVPADTPGDASPTAAEGCVDRTAGPSAAIEQQDFKFVPECVVMTANQGFSIRNTGSVLHNFSIDKFEGIDLDIQPGQTNNTETPGLSPDAIYNFFCEYHKDRGMTGELRVESG